MKRRLQEEGKLPAHRLIGELKEVVDGCHPQDGSDVRYISETTYDAAAVSPATVRTEGHAPIFLASGCDAPNAAK